jgi:hypothetical protein
MHDVSLGTRTQSRVPYRSGAVERAASGQPVGRYSPVVLSRLALAWHRAMLRRAFLFGRRQAMNIVDDRTLLVRLRADVGIRSRTT